MFDFPGADCEERGVAAIIKNIMIRVHFFNLHYSRLLPNEGMQQDSECVNNVNFLHSYITLIRSGIIKLDGNLSDKHSLFSINISDAKFSFKRAVIYEDSTFHY